MDRVRHLSEALLSDIVHKIHIGQDKHKNTTHQNTLNNCNPIEEI